MVFEPCFLTFFTHLAAKNHQYANIRPYKEKEVGMEYKLSLLIKMIIKKVQFLIFVVKFQKHLGFKLQNVGLKIEEEKWFGKIYSKREPLCE